MCGKRVLGCDQNDKCEATMMCMIHFYAYGKAMGSAQIGPELDRRESGDLPPEFAEMEKEALRFSEWRDVVDSALLKAGFRRG